MQIYRVHADQPIHLPDIPAVDTRAFKGDKQAGKTQLKVLNKELESLQELLYAEGKRKLLVVLQGMDASGKDGTIRHVFEGVNPQGVKVASFKAPSKKELAHDYLWRVHQQVPAQGEITIFNRSHYEDVLIVRVKNFVPESVWSKRYAHIRDFERMLFEEGTTILKFFLHIDRDEQKARLQARLDESSKNWKFNPGDLTERKLWDAYQKAFEDAFNETSTEHAPWFIVPGNRKWYRNIVIASTMVETLKNFHMEYPQIDYDPAEITIE